MDFKDYYQTLGVAKTANEKEIKQAFRKLARKFHPDVNPGDKGAEAKFALAIRKSCDPTLKPALDCPECYSGGDCSPGGEAGNRVQNIEGQIDSFGPGVFCEQPGADAAEDACEYNTAKTLAKLVGSVNKCYDKCFANVRKGLLAPGVCGPPATDPATDPATVSAQPDPSATPTPDPTISPDPSATVTPDPAPSVDTGATSTSAAGGGS